MTRRPWTFGWRRLPMFIVGLVMILIVIVTIGVVVNNGLRPASQGIEDLGGEKLLPATVERWWELNVADKRPVPGEAGPELAEAVKSFPGDLVDFGGLVPDSVRMKIREIRDANGCEQRADRTIASECFRPNRALASLSWDDPDLYVAAVLLRRMPDGAIVPVPLASPPPRRTRLHFAPAQTRGPHWLILRLCPLHDDSVRRLDRDLLKKTIAPFVLEFQ